MVYSALKGRIGNNMFQIAAGISLAKKYNDNFLAWPHKTMQPEPDFCLLSEYLEQFHETILRKVTIREELPENSICFEEENFTYSPIKYQKDIRLEGYFQSEKYFDHDLVRQTFSIDDKTLAYIKDKYSFLFSEEFTSINIRRGDFLKVSHYHPVCSLKYFNNAIKYLGYKNKYLIISDDIEWCKNNFKGVNFIFVDDENPTVDLYLQTFCKNNIISNSTFCWWGAWLNNNPGKIVIAPAENWFGKYHGKKDLSDLLPENWIKLPNPLAFSVKLIIFHTDILVYGAKIKKRIKQLVRYIYH